MTRVAIRDYEPRDRPAVRRICYETAFMGRSIAPQYRDLESYADMFTGYFTDVEPEHAHVAELDGQVVGYALAALDARKVWTPLRVALRHAFLRGACFRPGTTSFYLRAACDMTHDLPAPVRPDIDFARYPSQMHVNLLPSARGGTTGKELVFRSFDRLVTHGSTGSHGESLVDNMITKGFWQKVLGIRVLGSPYPVPGMRSDTGGRVFACLGVRDLTSWRFERSTQRSASVTASAGMR